MKQSPTVNMQNVTLWARVFKSPAKTRQSDELATSVRAMESRQKTLQQVFWRSDWTMFQNNFVCSMLTPQKPTRKFLCFWSEKRDFFCTNTQQHFSLQIGHKQPSYIYAENGKSLEVCELFFYLIVHSICNKHSVSICIRPYIDVSLFFC